MSDRDWVMSCERRAADAREALAEIEAGAIPVPGEQVWAELGLY